MSDIETRLAKKRLPGEQDAVRLLIEQVTLAARACGEVMLPEPLSEGEARAFIGRVLRVVGRAIETNTGVCLNELRSGTATCKHNE